MPIPQKQWRYCNTCFVLFYDGYPDKGRCPGGGGHTAAGYNFWISYDEPETLSVQKNWRYCNWCKGMFYDGYNIKGKCPARAEGHEAIGYNFTLDHDLPDVVRPQPWQKDWRYCNWCQGLFFDGYNWKGKCPHPTRAARAEGHEAIGYNFLLLHDPSIEDDPGGGDTPGGDPFG